MIFLHQSHQESHPFLLCFLLPQISSFTSFLLSRYTFSGLKKFRMKCCSLKNLKLFDQLEISKTLISQANLNWSILSHNKEEVLYLFSLQWEIRKNLEWYLAYSDWLLLFLMDHKRFNTERWAWFCLQPLSNFLGWYFWETYFLKWA